MPSDNTPRPVSLLWPPDRVPPPGRQGARLPPASASDLDVESTVAALSAGHGHAARIRDVLLGLCDDPAVIAYRQAVLADLLDTPELAGRLADLLPRLGVLDGFGYSARPDQSPLHEVVWRIGQLESYVECVQGLSAVFDGLAESAVRAEGWRALRSLAHALADDATFRHLVAELPDMLARVRGIASVTIGVNLDDQLRPVEATLLAVNNRRFRGPGASLLGALLGRDAPGAEWDGIAPLHAARPITPARGVDLGNPLLYPLFRDLADVMKKISRPVASALRRYMRLNVGVLGELSAELAFYLGAARLVERLHACGLPMCRPEIAPRDERVCAIQAAYNVNLALRLIAREGVRDLRETVIANDVNFGPDGRIFVLTGPNQGGKTTYTQAVGLAQVLAQAGLWVPGERARISPADNVHTHFPAKERPEMETGRLGEEAGRLGAIFAQATRHSLILLNESLASTSPGESLYLARDVLRALRLLGARAIYATHLHDLAAGVDEVNAETPGDSRVISLVSLAREIDGSLQQTYRIVPGPPRGRSYAREIAARYGISYEQLAELLRTRGAAE